MGDAIAHSIFNNPLCASLCDLCTSAFRFIQRIFSFYSFGQLAALDYLSAPALQDFAGTQIYAASRVQTNFEFDAGGNRARQIKQRIAAGDASRQLEETLYLGAYEREYHRTRPVGSGTFVTDRTVHRHSLGGFAVYTRTDTPATGSVTKLTTILKDHLGSTDVLFTGTWNGSSFVSPATERQSFDPWGERRAPDTLVSYRATDTDAFRASAQDYDRGYTDHEQLDDSGLIHMNGRLYDPELGRMLSPDPYVQVPEYSQNFNRYSYVMNNPLNLTDPTGFSWLGSIGDWLQENWVTVVVIVVVAVLTYFTAGIASAWGAGLYASATGAAVGGTAATAAGYAISGAYIGAVAGGLGAALNGGDLGDVLRGAAIGAVQGAITGGVLHGMGEAAQSAGFFSAETALHVAGHGVVGGAANAAMGGKFQDGFLSAAASAGAADAGAFGAISGDGAGAVAGRTAVAGVVGGTASALGGGKFANGAYTAAFQHLVNAEAGNVGKNLLNGIGKGLDAISRSPLGYIWNLPNTAIGIAWGGIGLLCQIGMFPFSGKWEFAATIANNAINFDGHPLMFSGAITIGNTSSFIPNSYLSDGYTYKDGTLGFNSTNVGADHEIHHTYQGQLAGPLYLPLNLIGGVTSLLTPIDYSRYPYLPPWHRNNFMENGPISKENH